MDGRGDHTLFTVKKENWETNHLIREMAHALGVSRKRLGFAGMKDKRAVTTQRMSAWDVGKERLKELSLKGVDLYDFRGGARVERGDLLGNEFFVNVRDDDEESFRSVQGEVERRGGVPNFYGIQRFGAQRPITHRVGAAVAEGDWRTAVEIYLMETWPSEGEDAARARERLKRDREFGEALNYFPERLRFERTLLHGLAEGETFEGTLEMLPENLLSLFLNAHQSLLFNEITCERMRSELPLNEPVEGDVVCFADPDTGVPNRHITERVRPRTEGKLGEMVEAGKAWVTAPLFGEDAKPAVGEPGELEICLIEDVEVDPAVEEKPYFPSGQRREVFLDVVPELSGSRLEFFLPKGCYATTVLREYMKADPLDMV